MDLEKISQMTGEEFDQLSKEDQQLVITAMKGKLRNDQAMFDQATADELKDEQIKDIHDENRAKMVAAAQGASFGLIDEAASAAIATAETIESTKKKLAEQGMAGFDNFLPSWKENYNQIHSAFERGMEDMRKKYPSAYDSYNMFGAIGSGLISGSAAPKLATSLLGRLGLASAEGFMHGAGTSSSETIGGRLEAGAQTALSTATGAGVVEGVLGVGGKTLEAVSKKVSPTALIEFVSDKTKDFNKLFNIKKKKQHQEFFERAADYVDKNGEYVLQTTHTLEDASESVKKAMMETGGDLGKIVSTIDDTGIIEKTDINQLIDILNERVIQRIPGSKTRISTKEVVDLQDKIKARVNNDFFMDDPSGSTIKLANGAEIPKRVLKDWKLADLVSYKNQLNDLIGDLKLDKSKGSQEYFQLERMRDEVHHFVNRNIENVSHKMGGENAELYNIYRQSATKYRDLANMSKLLDQRVQNNTGISLFNKLFRDSWGKMTVGATAAAYTFGVEPGPIGTTIGALSIMASHPTLNKSMSLGLHRIIEASKKNPGKYARRIENVVVASDVSGEAFYNELQILGAEVDLTEQPLNRTNEELAARKDSLLTVADDINPDLREILAKTFDEGNPDVLAKLILETPELNKFLSPGLGWNGKAVTDQDKAAVQSYISKLKPRAKRDATLEFNQSMKIPTGMLINEPPSIEEIFKHKRIKDKVKKPRF